MRRLLAAAIFITVLAAASALPAAAQDFERGTVRAAIQTAADAGAPERAFAEIDRVLDDATPRIRERHVEAAKAAMEYLPREEASPRIARLLAEALRIDSSDRDGAWTLAQSLRRDLIRRADVETAVRFLEKLIEVYPQVSEYRHDLARILLDAGRREEARATLDVLFRMAPSDTWAAYTLAVLAEEEGDFATATAWYDRLIDARPQELRAHLLKSRVLAKRDPTASRRAIEIAVRAAEASPSESLRSDYLEAFARERARLDDDDRRRSEIAAIEAHQRKILGFAAATWIFALAMAFRFTRAARAVPRPVAS